MSYQEMSKQSEFKNSVASYHLLKMRDEMEESFASQNITKSI